MEDSLPIKIYKKNSIEPKYGVRKNIQIRLGFSHDSGIL
jgi:hypothetical protein